MLQFQLTVNKRMKWRELLEGNTQLEYLEGYSCNRMEIPVTGKKILPQEENSCHRKEIPGQRGHST